MAHVILHVQIPQELDEKLGEMISGLQFISDERVTKKRVVVKALEKAIESYDENYREQVAEARIASKIDAGEELF